MRFCTNSWRIKIAMESYFEEHAQGVWERNSMNPEMLRKQLKENHQLNAVEEIAAQYQKSFLSMVKSCKEEAHSGMMATVGICLKILCWLRDVKR